MALTQTVQSVVEDAARLADELETIPATCDCGDADAHVALTCCGHIPNMNREPLGDIETCAGCVHYLRTLRLDVASLREDLERLNRDEESEVWIGDIDPDVERLWVVANQIDATVGSIERHLDDFRQSCAHSALARLKAHSSALRERSGALERACGFPS